MEATQPSLATQAITCTCQTEPFMTVEAAATFLDMSRDYLYVGAKDGRFPAVRLGRRIKFLRKFVLGFVKEPSGTKFEDYAAEWIAREAEAVAS